MDKSPENMKKTLKKLLIIVTIFLLIMGLYIYTNTDYVIIRFNELGALNKNMAVYYNGFKVGKVVYIGPDKDFKHTLARINLLHKNINLPQNTTVKVESFPNGELYLQFVYPQSPSLKTIKRGEVLEGIATYSLEEFMLGQNISGVTDIVSIHVLRALNATEIANQEIQVFFQNTSKLVKENSKGIKLAVDNTASMTKSFAQMAENLNQASRKINNALDEKDLKDTTSNIRTTTENIADATENIDSTIKKLDDTIYQANAVAANLNAITSGLNETLSQRFAGMRIIFGTPVKQRNCIKNACK